MIKPLKQAYLLHFHVAVTTWSYTGFAQQTMNILRVEENILPIFIPSASP